MQPIPGLDPQPPRRVVAGIQVQGRGEWRVILGLLIVGYGALLTAAMNGQIVAQRILAHWYFPVALMLLGVYKIFRSCSGMGRGVGGILTVLSLWWIASDVYDVSFDIGHWWPLAIVAFGVLVVMKSMTQHDDDAAGAPPFPGPQGFGAAPFGSAPSAGDSSASTSAAAAATAPPASAAGDTGPISAFAFWSGVHRRVSAAFKRVNLAAFMGGIELDLRPSVTVGGQAVVELFVFMGGVEITVPPDWTVHNEALVIMGGIDDRSSGSAGASQTLVIRGLILMGGVEIKT